MDRYTCPKCHAVSHNLHDVANLYCGACHTFAEDLRNEPVTEFDHLLDKYRGRLTRRDCFSLAILTIMESPDNPEARLVHGIVRDSFNPGRYVQHAWSEFPAQATYSDGSTGPCVVVVDYSQLDERARIAPRDDIYKAMDVREVRRYTREEAIAEALEFGMDGPWDSSPGGVDHE